MIDTSTNLSTTTVNENEKSAAPRVVEHVDVVRGGVDDDDGVQNSAELSRLAAEELNTFATVCLWKKHHIVCYPNTQMRARKYAENDNYIFQFYMQANYIYLLVPFRQPRRAVNCLTVSVSSSCPVSTDCAVAPK